MPCCWPPPSTPAPGERVLDLGAGVGVGRPLPRQARAGLHDRRHRAAAGAGAARRAQCRPATASATACARSSTTSPSPCRADLGLFDQVATNPPYLAAAVADPSPDPQQGAGDRRIERRPRALAGGRDRRPETCRHPDADPSQRPAGGDRRSPGRGWAAATSRSSACRPPRACWCAPDARDAPSVDANRRRWCCTGRKAATPRRPRRSCGTPRRLTSRRRAATVPAMFNWLRNRFRRGPVVPVVRLSGVIAAGGLLGSRGLSIEIGGAAARPRLRPARRQGGGAGRSIRRADRRCSRR